MTLVEFTPQCCDASILELGQNCAQDHCYDGLRPMGAMFWFSLPSRLGLPPRSFILAHYLLLAISVFLSGWVLQGIRRQPHWHTLRNHQLCFHTPDIGLTS